MRRLLDIALRVAGLVASLTCPCGLAPNQSGRATLAWAAPRGERLCKRVIALAMNRRVANTFTVKCNVLKANTFSVTNCNVLTS